MFVDIIVMVLNYNFIEFFFLELLEKMRMVIIFILVFILVKKWILIEINYNYKVDFEGGYVRIKLFYCFFFLLVDLS